VVAILQYVESDYPAAVHNHDQAELKEQVALLQEAAEGLERLGPSAAPLERRVKALAERVAREESAAPVQKELESLVEAVASTGELARQPHTRPDLAQGARLFQSLCVSCHGAQGRGDGPSAAAIKPPPEDLQGPKLLSPYQVYGTVTFGVRGTAMAPFVWLSDEERWALGFYVVSLRHLACHGETPAAPLESLANRTDAELLAIYGPDAVACLRRSPPAPTAQGGLSLAHARVQRAVALAEQGALTQAREELLDAYLEGVEPIEPQLRARSPGVVSRLEAAFLEARLAGQKGAPELERQGRVLLTTIEAAERETAPRADAARFTSVFWLALLVVVRESFEAVVVVAALLAVLKKLQQEAHARVVHAGWISALIAGALSFALGQRLLAGANREWMEGIVALVAVVMLLYAALWLNARTNLSRYMGDLRARMQGALGQGSAAGLFFIAFSAAFREFFETALFLEGLSIDSRAGALWGGLAGLGVMAGVVFAIHRVGYRLPMKPLFKASTVLLVVTAIVLLGKGIHALQEVGALPLRPIPLFTFEPLGIFPDALSFIPQLLLALAPLVWKWVSPRRSGDMAPDTPDAQRN
jgi:high-affinity iron transporter